MSNNLNRVKKLEKSSGVNDEDIIDYIFVNSVDMNKEEHLFLITQIGTPSRERQNTDNLPTDAFLKQVGIEWDADLMDIYYVKK